MAARARTFWHVACLHLCDRVECLVDDTLFRWHESGTRRLNAADPRSHVQLPSGDLDGIGDVSVSRRLPGPRIWAKAVSLRTYSASSHVSDRRPMVRNGNIRRCWVLVCSGSPSCPNGLRIVSGIPDFIDVYIQTKLTWRLGLS
jgi:hypothetical protein